MVRGSLVPDKRHGGPWDRGGADSYYRREFNPHYYVGATQQSELIPQEQMTQQQIDEYTDGFYYNEELGHFKEW